MVDKCIKDRLKLLSYRDNVSNTNDIIRQIPENCITVPYIKGLSERLLRILKNHGLHVLYTVPKSLDCVIRRGKDRLDCFKQTNLVYKINCGNCDATYIGQTKRHLETRIKEHKADIKKHVSNHSVVSRHRTSYDHEFEWHKTEILHCEKQVRKREIAEMFFIKQNNNTINLQKDTDNLTGAYDIVIKNI